MPIVHRKGQPVSESDLATLQKMVSDSFQSLIDKMHSSKKLQGYKDDQYSIFDPLVKIYQKEALSITDKFQKAAKQKREITVTELLEDIYESAAQKVLRAVDREDRDFGDAATLFAREFGGKLYSHEFMENEPDDRDTAEGYERTTASFTLTDEPAPGIGDIDDYKPESGRVLTLYEARSGNSNTLSSDIKELEQHLARAEEGTLEYEEAKQRLLNAQRAPLGLHAGAEYSRLRSSELIGKDHISFSDLYETITTINKMARPGDPEGGMLRGGSINAGDLLCPAATAVPQALYKTLSTIAENMNIIKQTDDPALRKTRAVQLAAFAYQMTLSEHSFSDGNGRTCRLFCDTILQTFGLPPHIPTKEETQITEMIGNEMDFNKGFHVFLNGVKLSDQELKKDPEIQKQKLISPAPEKEKQVNNPYRMSALYEVNEETVNALATLKDEARHAKGFFKNSPEYKALQVSIDKCLILATKIQENRDKAGFNITKAEAAYASAVRGMRKAAKAYVTYKMKDHTANKKVEPGKKKLNGDDKRKLNLVKKLLDNKELVKEKKPHGGPGIGM